MPAATSILGQCADCCDCPAPVLRWDSRSAAKAKCGYSGTFEVASAYIPCLPATTPPTFYQRQNRVATAAPGGCVSPTSEVFFNPGTNPDYQYFDDTCTFRQSATTFVAAGNVLATYGEEYTTADLVARVQAALAALGWDGDWNDTPGSYRSLSANETTLALRDSRYEWRVPRHKVGSGRCYGIRWKQRFTPEGGGAPVDTPMCAVWDYEATPDYDPDDVTTWPKMKNGELDYWELPPPSANGTTTVEDIEWFCLCREAVCP